MMDESTFQDNDDQPIFWAEKGTNVMRLKPKGSGIKISDFIEERDGYLALTKEQYDAVKSNIPSVRMYARQHLEYGKSRGGYWTSDKFTNQIRYAIKIVKVKYPKNDGWGVAWAFDHSSCHSAMLDDTLDVSRMNDIPGGKQRVIRDGMWQGKISENGKFG